jgi:hypothetical protein
LRDGVLEGSTKHRWRPAFGNAPAAGALNRTSKGACRFERIGPKTALSGTATPDLLNQAIPSMFHAGAGWRSSAKAPRNPLAFVALRDKLIDVCSAFANEPPRYARE